MQILFRTAINLLLVVSLAIVSAGGPVLQKAPNLPGSLDLVSHFGGLNLAITLSNTRAFLGEGNSLAILDIQDIYSPDLLGKSAHLPETIRDIDVVGDYAYIADGEAGVFVLDISNPITPTLVGQKDTPGFANRITVSDNLAFVADRTQGLRILDVSDLSSITETGFFLAPAEVLDVKISASRAFLAAGDSGLRVVDITDPGAPGETAFFDTPDIASGIVISATTAYIADLTSLQIIDITNPDAPDGMGSLITDEAVIDLAVLGSTIYLAGGTLLPVVSVLNPSAPVKIGEYASPSYTHAVAASGNLAYVADEYAGLRVIDFTDPAAPLEYDPYEQSSNAQALDVSNGFAFIADGARGLRIAAVNNPFTAGVISTLDTLGFARDVVISGDHAYLADGDTGLVVVDATAQNNPQAVGSLDTPGSARGISLHGNYVYIADGITGLQVMDISDPTLPQAMGSYDTPGTARDVAVAYPLAFVADTDSLHILDISNPVTPTLVAQIATPGVANSVAITGTLAFVADTFSGLQIFDAADPSQPVSVGFYQTTGAAYDVFLAGKYAFVSSEDRRLLALDVSDPAQPQLHAEVVTPAPARGLSVSGGSIYLAGGTGGVQIYTFTPGNQASYQVFMPSLALRYPVLHTIQGHVLDAGSNPVSGVIISAGSGVSAQTDLNGAYSISDLPAGTYTLTPSRPNTTFNPSARQVILPPNATGQDFTATIVAPPCTDLVTNGGFEQNSGWEIPTSAIPAVYSSDQIHGGTRSLRTGIASGTNRNGFSIARQQVSIPSGATSATLTFWLYPQSSETGTADYQYVYLLNTDNTLLERLVRQTSNSRTWTHYTFDLLAHAGRTLKIAFGTYNNGTGGITAMYADDVKIEVCTP